MFGKIINVIFKNVYFFVTDKCFKITFQYTNNKCVFFQPVQDCENSMVISEFLIPKYIYCLFFKIETPVFLPKNYSYNNIQINNYEK